MAVLHFFQMAKGPLDPSLPRIVGSPRPVVRETDKMSFGHKGPWTKCSWRLWDLWRRWLRMCNSLLVYLEIIADRHTETYLNVLGDAVEDLRCNTDGSQEAVFTRLIYCVLAHVVPVEVHYGLLHMQSHP